LKLQPDYAELQLSERSLLK